MNNTKKEKELTVTFRNYSREGEETLFEEYGIELKLLKEDVEKENTEKETDTEEEQNIINGYGLYTILTDFNNDFNLYIIPQKKWEENKKDIKVFGEYLILTNKELKQNQKKTERREFFPIKHPGFIFYSYKKEPDVYIVFETKGKKKEFFVSNSIRIGFGDESQEQEIFFMTKEIYEHQPQLFLSVFRKAPLNVFLGENSNIENTWNTVIVLIQKSVVCYQQYYTDIVRAAKYKLKEYQYIDRIQKLTKLEQSTFRSMAQNPQYLVEVKTKGIKYKGKSYLPEKTLVNRNVIDYHIYENEYIVSFLKFLILECQKIKIQLSMAIKDAKELLEEQKIPSKKAEYGSLVKQYEDMYQIVEKNQSTLNGLFLRYKAAFGMSHDKQISGNIKKPNTTAIFRQIPEYNQFLNNIFLPWFNYGMELFEDQENTKDVFINSVSSPSTSYELYIITKWIQYLSEIGYSLRKEIYAGISEKESNYLDSSYSFEFVNESDNENCETITLFYSPSIYIPVLKMEDGEIRASADEKNVDQYLCRTTDKSMIYSKNNGECYDSGVHYEPDFIIKYEQGSKIRYVIADAKHKDYEEVREKDIFELMFKYMFSCDVLKRSDTEIKIDAKIVGLYALYSEHSYDKKGNVEEDITDFFPYRKYVQNPGKFVKAVYINAIETEESDGKELSWKLEFSKMLQLLKNSCKTEISNLQEEETNNERN